MIATLVVPVSRPHLVDKLVQTLAFANFSFDISLLVYVDTNLKTVYDSIVKKFNYAVQNNSRIAGVDFIFSGEMPLGDFDRIKNRRDRICRIWNTIKKKVKTPIVMGLEDDTTIRIDAFDTLVNWLLADRSLGFVSGVQAGRWKEKMIGAWRITENEVTTLLPSNKRVEEVDGAGLYCFATYTEYLRKHDFTHVDMCFGPDVLFVKSIVDSGKKAMVDWSIQCGHIGQDGTIEIDGSEVALKWVREGENWQYLGVKNG